MSRLTDEQELGKRTEQDRADTPEAREARIRFHEQRIEGMGLAGRGRGVAGQSRATTVPPKPPRGRKTPEQLALRRKELRQRKHLAALEADPPPSPSDAVAVACLKVGADPILVMSKVRTPWACESRWRVWRLLRDSGLSASAIGRLFRLDHSVVCYGLRTLRQLDEKNAWKCGHKTDENTPESSAA